MSTITFYDYQNPSNVCQATGAAESSYTIKLEDGSLVLTAETSNIVFKDHIGNEINIATSPFIKRDIGALGYGVQVKISITMKHVSGEIYTQDIYYPRGRTGSQFRNTTASVTLSWVFKSQSTTYRKYDVTENYTSNIPMKTDYNQYETSDFSTMTLFLQYGPNRFTDIFDKTLSNDKNSYTEKPVNHNFFYYHSLAADTKTTETQVQSNLINVFMNGVLMAEPYIKVKEINDSDGKTFLHKNNDSFTTWNGGSTVSTKLVTKGGRLTASTELNLHFDRNLKIFGKIFSFDELYPDLLKVKIDGLPGGFTNETQVISGDIVPKEYLFEKFYINSNLAGSFKSFQRDTIPSGQISTGIDTDTLDKNLDDISYKRLPFRGLNFTAIQMYHDSQTAVLEGITYATNGVYIGNVRDFRTRNRNGSYTNTYKNFNSYRYLELLVRCKTGLIATGVVTLECPSDTKQYNLNVTSDFKRVTIDLCSPVNKNSIVDIQDNPYPRLLITDRTFTTNEIQERINGDYFGVSRVFRILIDNPNIEIKFDAPTSEYGVYLARKNFVKSNFLAERLSASNQLKKIYTDKIIGQTITRFLGRRYWQIDVDGRNEEEWDWGYENQSEVKRTIKNFTDSLLKYHSGWKIKNYIQKGDLKTRSWYLNSIDGNMSWLGGDGVTFTTPGKYIYSNKISDKYADVVLWLNQDTSLQSLSKEVLAQTVFDSINGNFIPYYDNPFENHIAKISPLFMNLAASVVLRGRVHGIVLDKNTNQSLTGSQVKLEYVLNNQPTNRGTSTSDQQGNFYTKLPFGLGLKEHNVTNLSLTLKNIIESAKQQRFVFKVKDVLKKQISAVENKLTNQILVAYNKSNDNVSLLSLDTIDNPFSYYTDLNYLNDPNSKFVGQNPVIVSSNTKNNYFNNSNSFVLAEKSKNIIIAANFHSDDIKNWYPYTSKIAKQDSLLLTISNLNSFCISNNSPELYNSFIDNGVLKLRVVNINLANITNAPNPFVYTIEIESSDDFASVVSLPSGDLLILFKIKSDSRKIFGRIFNNGSLSQRFLVVDSSIFTNSPADIFSPNAVFDEKLNVVKIVFYHKTSLIYAECNLINLLSKSSSNLNKYHHVVGNEKESDYKTNIVSYYSTENISLPVQKAGIISSSRANKTDEVIVFYQDNNNLINSILIKPYKNTSKINIYNVN